MGNPKTIYFEGPSEQALVVFADAPQSTGQPIQSINVDQVRVETISEYGPPAQRSREQHCQAVTEETVNGIRYLRIVPKSLDRTLQDKVGVYFFGGGFIAGSPELDLIVSAAIAQALGIVMLSPDYRLAPENRFPAGLEDCAVFYKSAVEAHRADNIFLMGESAGANLAMSTLLKAFKDGIPMPKAIVLLSPVTDQSGDPFSPEFLYQEDPALFPENVGRIQELYAPEQPNDDPLVSPHFGSYGSWFPPTLFTSGTKDVFQFQVRKTAEKMAASNVDVTIHMWEGMWHVFEYYPEIPEALRSIDHIADFVRSHLKGEK